MRDVFGSRFMLPEHSQAIQNKQDRTRLQPKPMLEEDQLELIERKLTRAAREKGVVTIVLFHPLGNQVVTGYVEKLSKQRRVLYLSDQQEVPLADIMDIM